MNTIHFYITPRQIGKSTVQEYEFLKDPENTICIYANLEYAKSRKLYRFYPKQFHSANQTFRGFSANKIIIDEYLFFTLKQRKQLYEIFPFITDSNGEIYIYSSPSIIYDSEIFQLVKKFKKLGYSYDGIVDEYSKKYNCIDDSIREKIEDLYYNFITEPDVIIHETIYADHNHLPSRSPFSFILTDYNSKREELKRILSPKDYLMQVEGVYLK